MGPRRLALRSKACGASPRYRGFAFVEVLLKPCLIVGGVVKRQKITHGSARLKNFQRFSRAAPAGLVAFSVEERYDSPVDFSQVLNTLLTEFDRHQIRYAAVGGFAMGVLGAPRGTQDLDFLVHHEDLGQLHQLMTTLGYQRAAVTENVSHYAHPDPVWGGVDILHGFRSPSLAILQRVKSRPIFSGALQIRSVDPEDVIGFKVQAMANNPKRRNRELVDIETLMELYGSRLDWSRIQEYFELFEMGEEGHALRTRFDHAQ